MTSIETSSLTFFIPLNPIVQKSAVADPTYFLIYTKRPFYLVSEMHFQCQVQFQCLELKSEWVNKKCNICIFICIIFLVLSDCVLFGVRSDRQLPTRLFFNFCQIFAIFQSVSWFVEKL